MGKGEREREIERKLEGTRSASILLCVQKGKKLMDSVEIPCAGELSGMMMPSEDMTEEEGNER